MFTNMKDLNNSVLESVSDINQINPLITYVTRESCLSYASRSITMQYVFAAIALIAIALVFYLLWKKDNLKPSKEEIEKLKSKVKD